MRYFLGLDNGGTTTKAAIFDETGREIGVSAVSTEILTAGPGFAERDMEEMWRANCHVISDVLKKTGVNAGRICGVGICGHGKGLYLWGKDDKPLGNGILSSDNRAYIYPQQWTADGTADAAFKLACQYPLACQPVALLAWIRDHEPERYRRIHWIFECKDYIRFRMTGKAAAERTDYSGTSLLNLHTGEYDPGLLALFGLEDIEGCLPPLCESTEICGHVTAQAAEQCGLCTGTPVIGGMFDIDACALAAGITNEENLCMIAGTWSINEYASRSLRLTGQGQLNSLFCVPGYYLIEESSPTSAGNNEWFVRKLLSELYEDAKNTGENLYQTINTWVASVPPTEFVPVFLPFLMGSNVHPNARGSFVGLSANHTRKHMLRSVYEGIAFSHRYHLDRLLANREKPAGCIRLVGGAARSDIWTQMFADIMNLPVVKVNVNESGALGCAIAVAAAMGIYENITEAAENMCALAEPVFPDPAVSGIYERKYQLYLRVIRCLDPLWEQMQQMVEECF